MQLLDNTNVEKVENQRKPKQAKTSKMVQRSDMVNKEVNEIL
jgi:hypothetical protein